MAKILVAYFSASGTTQKVAKTLAEAIGADLFEIRPETPYSKADLNWMNKNSRSTIEMNDRSCRPAIAAAVDGMEQYDTVFVGFPVWWYREPSIIDTFMESYDFSGKTVIPFCTSGGGSPGEANADFRKYAPGADLRSYALLNRATPARISAWLDTLGLD